MSDMRTRKGLEPDSGQTQFLNVITRDEATARFREHLQLAPLGKETLPLRDSLHRVLAEDVLADMNRYFEGLPDESKESDRVGGGR